VHVPPLTSWPVRRTPDQVARHGAAAPRYARPPGGVGRWRNRPALARGLMTLALAGLLGLLGLPGLPVGGPAGVAHAEADPAPMRRVDFLEGRWQGEGWIDLGPGRRERFAQTEVVESRLGGAALLIEGQGVQPRPPGSGAAGAGDEEAGEPVVIHQALAVLTYDAAGQRYAVRAYLSDGRAVDAEAQVVDGALVWGFRPDPSGPARVRYTIRLSDAGEWAETGDVSLDGQTWRPFFEMTLRRAAPA